ncbi:MAG: helix-turn-helix transcriptional regulator [Candidatus Thorarchaeota archaeon]
MTPEGKLSPIITSTRRMLLESLLESDANAVTLATQLGINISAIRSHLDVLEIAGLVTSRHEHAKRGRPKRIYVLTPLAHSLFPQQTQQVIALLFKSLSRSLSAKTTNSIIKELVADLWQQILYEKLEGSLEDRVRMVTNSLDNYGFYAKLEVTKEAFVITIHNDVFYESFKNVPLKISEQFWKEFWNQFSQGIGRVLVQINRPQTPGQHGMQILVKERRE